MIDTSFGAAVNNAVRNTVQEHRPDRMVTRSVVVYEYINERGARELDIWPSEDARWWDVQGLCHFALSTADANIAEDVRKENLRAERMGEYGEH